MAHAAADARRLRAVVVALLAAATSPVHAQMPWTPGAAQIQRHGAPLRAFGEASERRRVTHNAALIAVGSEGIGQKEVRPKLYKVNVLKKLPHVDKPFTQGLEFKHDGSELIETSGSFPVGKTSFVRGVDPNTGATLWKNDDGLGDSFIEGIAQVGGATGSWFASVYQTPRKALEYDKDFNFIKAHPYHFDGWGLTRNMEGNGFLATNGSSTVMYLEPKEFKLVGSKVAMCLGRKVPALNELEMVDDFLGSGKPALLANVYTSRVVLVLDPSTMRCTGAFDLDGVDEAIQAEETLGYHVANGIAYNRATQTFFLTGKNWESMFEVKLEEVSSGSLAETTNHDAIGKLSKWLESKHTAPGILD